MASILRDMPFFPEPGVVSIPASPVIPIFANQIIVWISIARRESPTLALAAVYGQDTKTMDRAALKWLLDPVE